MMVAVHPAHAAAARLGGVMGAQPWGPSPWSPSSRRRGPGEEDMGMGSMGRHKLISFLDDVDPDADESEYVLPCCPSSLTFSPSLTLSTSVPVTYYSLIDSCDENDDDAIGSDLSTEADFSNSHIYPRPASSSSSTGPTATAIVTAATTQATTQAQAETQAQAQATVTTSTMAPMTNADSFLSLGGGGGDARSHGQTTTVAGTAVYRRTSEDSVDGSHGLWDYFHHGLDGNSTPDLHQFQQQRRQPTQQSKQQQQRHNLQQQHHQHHHHHRHCHQQQHQSSSPTSYLSLYLRPKSSRSHQTLLNVPQTNSESATTGSLTAARTASPSTWPLSITKSHEKKGSSGSSKTTASTATAATTTTTTTTIQNMRETLSSAGSATIVAPPPVSPSTGFFGAEMTKQEFEALPEAIQRKVSENKFFFLVVFRFYLSFIQLSIFFF
ncbi:hypothetical protein LY78DRAFT_310548 [Colletotrichum sublineola]|nr:hypothetical protein LY78DRAFT_310548 [Colletotrichum sublineola]